MNCNRKLTVLWLFAFVTFPSLGFAQGETTRFIEGGSLIIAPVDGANSFQVYSKEVGKWSNIVIPNSIEATPVVSTNICTFKLEGKKITHLVAVDAKGNVVKQKLPKPTTSCNPIVSAQMAAFVVDGRAYAFSAVVGRWDVIDSPVTPQILNGAILVVAPDRIGTFSAKTGKWSVARTKIKTAYP